MDMTKKLTKDLIEMYWQRKCLWQVNSMEYKKRDKKKKAYQEMVAFLRRNGVKDASVKLVREKIQNLRRAMRKEKKRIDDSGGEYCATLWYYDLLSFVNDQYEDTTPAYMEPIDNDNTIICTDSDEEMNQVDNALTENPQKNKTDARSSNVFKNKETKQATLPKNPDEFQALGINLAAKLKRMESTQQIFAELLIQKVLARGLLGQLNETTELIDIVQEGCITRLGAPDIHKSKGNEFSRDVAQ